MIDVVSEFNYGENTVFVPSATYYLFTFVAFRLQLSLEDEHGHHEIAQVQSP